MSALRAVDDIAARIAAAAADGEPLALQGGGSRRFYGNPPTGAPLDLSPLSGVLEYEPSELFVSVAAATPLAEIESLLRENGQMLAFEPPHFSPRATAGGALACGLSGPRRPSGGALRDHVLGVSILDGRGRRLVFGGKVIKNVAGFDVSRLMAGTLGVFGVVAEIVFRVAPLPECEITTSGESDAAEAVAEDNRLLAAGLPLTGGAWHSGRWRRRFSGGEKSLRRAARESGGDIVADAVHQSFWTEAREQTHDFFAGGEDLWRIAAPPLAPLSEGDAFIEWHGATRWRRGRRADAEAAAKRAGGAATLFRAADAKCGGRFPPPPPPLLKIYRNLKKVFDPADILNRGRLYDFGG